MGTIRKRGSGIYATVKAEGDKDLEGNVNAKLRKKQHAFARGMRLAGLYLQRESQRLVPVDTGALRASARTWDNGKDGFDIVVWVGYGQHYAIWVHEMTHIPHKIGQAKYLEHPARARRKEIKAIIAREMNR